MSLASNTGYVQSSSGSIEILKNGWNIFQSSKLIPINIFESLTSEKAAELIDLRLPSNLNSCIRLQPKGFTSDSYFVEDNVVFKDEKGIQQTKTCPVTSFIRWRYTDKNPTNT